MCVSKTSNEIKLIDFGLAQVKTCFELTISSHLAKFLVLRRAKRFAFYGRYIIQKFAHVYMTFFTLGTPEFAAPEVIRYEPLSFHTDMVVTNF